MYYFILSVQNHDILELPIYETNDFFWITELETGGAMIQTHVHIHSRPWLPCQPTAVSLLYHQIGELLNH